MNLKIKSSFRTNKLLKEKLPMKYFSERKIKRVNAIYKIDRYTVENQYNYENKLDIIKQNTTKNYFQKLLDLCISYEKKYKIEYIYREISKEIIMSKIFVTGSSGFLEVI